MTSLHYILIGIGVALVVLLAIYNHFQERRFRKQADRIFSQRRDDVPLGASLGETPFAESMPDTRIEPTFKLVDEVENATSSLPTDPDEVAQVQPDASAWDRPGQADAGLDLSQRRTLPDAADVSPTVAPESPLDVEIEYVARLRYTHPTPIGYAPLLESLSRISKPIRVVGRREDGAWESVDGQHARTYDTVELALLLADRNGPVTAVQLDSFCNRLYEFVAQYGGAASCPDKAAALDRANELDAFCAGVDMLIGLNVVTTDSQGFPAKDVRRLAESAGLVLGKDGRYSLNDSSGHRMFVLATNQDEPAVAASAAAKTNHSLSLLFDVPRVAREVRVFDRMTEFGQSLADALAGRLVDDGGRPVSPDSLDKDRQRLAILYARMDERGIPAGGERALRLFA